MWLSLVECLVRDQEAGGSNPLTPTNKKRRRFAFVFLLQEEDLKSSEVNDSLGRLSEPSVTERRRAARIKSSHSDGQNRRRFAFVFLLQEEDLKNSEVNDSLGRLSEPSVTERRRAARIKSSHSDFG